MNLNKLKYYILIAAIILGLSSTISTQTYAAIAASAFANTAEEPAKAAEESGDDDADNGEFTAAGSESSAEGDEDDDEDDEEATADDDGEDGETAVYADEEVVVTREDGKIERIELPEGMMADLDETLDDYTTKHYLAEDTTSTTLDINPVFENEIYKERLKKLPTPIEMPWNEVVQKFIDRYTGSGRRTVSVLLGKENLYMGAFEQALETYGMPLELKYLPVIESALNTQAVSRMGAAGLWQFMIGTGKLYGLRINSLIDERRDPVKASYAAAHCLSDLYQMFGDWNLAIAAYNCGPGNVQKAIQRAGGERDYWKIYNHLPSETRGYVPAFIAANYIMTYYREHNITPMIAKQQEETDTIMLFRNVHFLQVSKVLDIDIDLLRSLNPQYRRDIVCGYSEPTDLRLPKEYIPKFIEKQEEIYNYDVDNLLRHDVIDVDLSHNRMAQRASRSYSGDRHRSTASRHGRHGKHDARQDSRSKNGNKDRHGKKKSSQDSKSNSKKGKSKKRRK